MKKSTGYLKVEKQRNIFAGLVILCSVVCIAIAYHFGFPPPEIVARIALVSLSILNGTFLVFLYLKQYMLWEAEIMPMNSYFVVRKDISKVLLHAEGKDLWVIEGEVRLNAVQMKGIVEVSYGNTEWKGLLTLENTRTVFLTSVEFSCTYEKSRGMVATVLLSNTEIQDEDFINELGELWLSQKMETLVEENNDNIPPLCDVEKYLKVQFLKDFGFPCNVKTEEVD